MEINIMGDVWNLVYVFLLCIIIAFTVLSVLIVALRAAFFFKSFRDPILSIKKNKDNLQSIIDNQREQDEISGNRL